LRVIIQTFLDGIMLGGVLSLAAAGFSLIFGVMNVVSLAHGAMVVIGAYLAYVCWSLLGIDPLLMVPLIMGILFILGYTGVLYPENHHFMGRRKVKSGSFLAGNIWAGPCAAQFAGYRFLPGCPQCESELFIHEYRDRLSFSRCYPAYRINRQPVYVVFSIHFIKENIFRS